MEVSLNNTKGFRNTNPYIFNCGFLNKKFNNIVAPIWQATKNTGRSYQINASKVTRS